MVMDCKWLSDKFTEICTNGDCPACGDFCPCSHYPEICRYSGAENASVGDDEDDGGIVWNTNRRFI